MSIDGKFVQANEYGKAVEEEVKLELTPEEQGISDQLKQVWLEILKIPIEEDTDFFATGAGSMDVVRLVEEVKDKTGVEITNEDVFMATQFGDFIQTVVKASRGGSGTKVRHKLSNFFHRGMFLEVLFRCETSVDNVILQIFDIFTNALSLFSIQLT